MLIKKKTFNVTPQLCPKGQSLSFPSLPRGFHSPGESLEPPVTSQTQTDVHAHSYQQDQEQRRSSGEGGGQRESPAGGEGGFRDNILDPCARPLSQTRTEEKRPARNPGRWPAQGCSEGFTVSPMSCPSGQPSKPLKARGKVLQFII